MDADADPKTRILVVDDEPTNRAVLVELLQGEYTVLEATNGADALALARESTPDIILLDVLMPGMDGFEVCRRLKSDESTRDVPVIFVTSLDDYGDEAQGLALGAADYITKPVQPALVLERVRSHVELAQHRRFVELLQPRAERELALSEAEREALDRLRRAR